MAAAVKSGRVLGQGAVQIKNYEIYCNFCHQRISQILADSLELWVRESCQRATGGSSRRFPKGRGALTPKSRADSIEAAIFQTVPQRGVSVSSQDYLTKSGAISFYYFFFPLDDTFFSKPK